MLHLGADIDGHDLRPLAAAIQKGHVETTRCLIERGALLREPDTPLTLACRSLSTCVVKALLEDGADVEEVPLDGTRPLMAVCSASSLDDSSDDVLCALVRLLLEHGASRTAVNRFGQTAREVALSYGNVRAASLLECP